MLDSADLAAGRTPTPPALEAAARELLRANTRAARHGGRTFRYTIPAERAYPFQWFWDSCFHAIVWSRHDWRRAADELAGLLHWREPDGMIPHVVFWDRGSVSALRLWHYLESRGAGRVPFARKPWTTALVQPPVLAQAVERIVAAGGGERYARETIDALERYHRYLDRERDRDGDGLVSTICQFETGLDYSPVATKGLWRARTPVTIFLRARWPEFANKVLGFDLDRIFAHGWHQEDVLVNTLWGGALRSLARLARLADRRPLAHWADRRAERVTQALLERSWDARTGLFYNLCGPRELPVRVKTVGSLAPLALEDLPAGIADRLVERLTDPRTFWTPYPVPSVARDEPSFRPTNRVSGVRFIWRGALSPNTNWLLVDGLRLHGHDAVAEELAARSRELAERHGFNEFYHPLSGEPVGAHRFGWATLVADMGATAGAGEGAERVAAVAPPPE